MVLEHGDNPTSAGDQQGRSGCEIAWNPQRPYAGHPEYRMMIWSRLHGDMQGRHARVVRSTTSLSKAQAKFLVG